MIGEGIESDVDLVVEGEMGEIVRLVAAEIEAVVGDAERMESVEDALADGWAGEACGFEEEAGERECEKDFGPESEHLSGDFGEVIEAAEGDRAVLAECDGRADIGLEAPGGSGESE